ncbi:MAG: insulinase family protein, partial [Opitutaceae bacterium]|nr:insulinase family protein [Opitutaceae bacterium]
MKLRIFLSGLLVMVAAVWSAQAGEGLVADPAARFGQLENGVRYVVYPNREPQGRASLRLLVQAGAFQEREDQRGVAHFLEHMAFNGSEHYAPGTLVEFFQRMGMSFGGDTNAFTSFERTQYMIELPKTDDATLTEGLHVLGDYAGGLLLLPEEIDRERGIILSEKIARDNVGFRTFVARLEFMLGDTLLPHRLPIGLETVIKDAPRERFVEFWNEWYRPDNIVIIAVGDFAPERAEALIRERFAGLQPRAPRPADPDLGKLPEFDGLRTWFHAEPEAPVTSISITEITPAPNEPDSAQKRVESLPRSLALSMLNRRFSELAKKDGAPFTQASVGVYDQYRLYRQAEVSVACKAGQWTEALAVGEQELRRALEHGFHAAELREVVAGFVNGLEQAVKRAPTRRSSGLANEIAGGIVEQVVFTHPEADRDLLVPALQKITPEQCLAALRAAFAAPGRFVMVTGNVEISGDAGAAIA